MLAQGFPRRWAARSRAVHYGDAVGLTPMHVSVHERKVTQLDGACSPHTTPAG
jgi:hypothetical protein